jgi:hypothetical protein
MNAAAPSATRARARRTLIGWRATLRKPTVGVPKTKDARMAIGDQTTTLARPVTRSTIGAIPAGKPMLIDRLMPSYDAVRTEHRIVPGDIATVYAATRRADFIRAWRESAAVRFLFAARGIGERAVSLIARHEHREPPPPESMRLADMPTHGDWVLLGEDPPSEIAFGVIGRFWAGETVWAQIDATDFQTFAQPGFGKIACNFSLRPYGADRTLVTYECRTLATDETARRGFMHYWRPLAPFIGVVMRSQLRVIEAETASR